MNPEVTRASRRTVLTGIAAGALVVGFDPIARHWVDAVQAASCPSFDHVPPLDGTLHLDAATRQADGRDLGRIVEQVPCAVLRQGSVEDISTMIRYCRQRGIKVATRGQGHTMYGQSLVGGLLIENRSIHSIAPEGADADAGVLWKELVLQAYQHDPRSLPRCSPATSDCPSPARCRSAAWRPTTTTGCRSTTRRSWRSSPVMGRCAAAR